MFDFSDKTVIVTGAGSGIGRATAEYFFACGANVMAADINADAVAATAAELDPTGTRIRSFSYDASLPDDARALVDATVKSFGGIDYLASCAGIYSSVLADQMNDEQWHRMVSVNLDGVFYLVSRAVPHMRDGGAIVTVASIAAHQGGTLSHAHYGATKGGVLAYTRGLARDLAPRIRANTVSPGTIDTPMVTKRIADGGDALRQTIPLKRFGKPSEIASVIAFLCSDAASYVTGEAIIASGGLYMG
ncbi:SDR family NAD(P)-dependent oxidoreductase [Rhizobium sp. CF142]|uniref:SDR family NAD(P)-dependent oxidoreductase n=1 Tax=Rhizobium sp. CF142 TaxID=1144314 RepID=UPI00026EEC26|nr:SDR family NAD(P)-dependent oxidoreductase [Rhizobium sp. CF142]EJJ26705.1 dehydrogenase of unknown specificity, short-chain alcohol dehydrogenase like protein [Rhizobium sp. CF142]